MIGGAFGIDLDALLSDRPPLTLPGASISSGRAALALLAHAHPGRWLLPAYLCASVLEPLRAAGVPFDFYPVGADLQPLELDVRGVEVLLVIDYFGFPPRDTAWLAGVRERCVVVEDCVMGSLVELAAPAGGLFGSVAFTSFRKYLPVPDGGVVVGLDVPPLPHADGAAVRNRLLGQVLRGAWLRGDVGDVEPVFLSLLAAGEDAFGTAPPAAMSHVSERLLASIDMRAAAERRRANFAALLDMLDASVEPLFDELPDGVSPLVLPVRVRDRDPLRSRLAERGIFCPVHWPLPPEVDAARFPAEHALAAEMLGLPIDQRYGIADMRRLADALAEAA